MSLSKSDSLRGVKLEWSVQLWQELDASVLKCREAGRLPLGTRYEITVEASFFGDLARVMAVRYGTHGSPMVLTQDRSFSWGAVGQYAREPEYNTNWLEASDIMLAAPSRTAHEPPATQGAAHGRNSGPPGGPRQPQSAPSKGKQRMRDSDNVR